MSCSSCDMDLLLTHFWSGKLDHRILCYLAFSFLSIHNSFSSGSCHNTYVPPSLFIWPFPFGISQNNATVDFWTNLTNFFRLLRTCYCTLWIDYCLTSPVSKSYIPSTFIICFMTWTFEHFGKKVNGSSMHVDHEYNASLLNCSSSWKVKSKQNNSLTLLFGHDHFWWCESTDE